MASKNKNEYQYWQHGVCADKPRRQRPPRLIYEEYKYTWYIINNRSYGAIHQQLQSGATGIGGALRLKYENAWAVCTHIHTRVDDTTLGALLGFILRFSVGCHEDTEVIHAKKLRD